MNTEMREFGMDQPILDGTEDFGPSNGDPANELGNNDDAPAGDNVYDRLRSELSKPADLEPVTLPVPARPGVALVYDVRIDMDTLQGWVKSATHRKKFRPRLMADIVISHCNIGITMNGNSAFDNDGENLTVTSQRIHEMLGVDPTHVRPAQEAIRLLFGSDGHVIGVLGKIMEEAGYGEQEWDEEGDSPLSLS